MDKIFLSHSSKDKKYVRPIFDYFGGDRCIFDEMTFEIGMPTLEEIFKGIAETDIFVFFISNDSLDSDWVKKEIYTAEKQLNNDAKRLSQIFPVIIDDSITYTDERIPDFLKQGFGAYNLRHIQSYKVACKKINDQLTKLRMERDLNYGKKLTFFYGRDMEKKRFKDCFDERDENGKIKHIKCLVISGIDGIGRKSYARAVLKDSEIMEQYYFPLSISLSKNDTIDDLILKLSFDLGLGIYTVDDISRLGTMDSKIDVLSDLICTAQRYREQIFIEDDMCIVKSSEIVYWFDRVLQKIGNSITLIVITHLSLNPYRYIKNKDIFSISLQNLEPSDTYGFLRGYSKLSGIPFEDEDIDFFSQILSGYPLQVQYCVDLAKANNSIKYVKDHSYEVADIPKANSAKILDIIIEENLVKEYNGFLALMAQLGTIPVNLLENIIKINPVYKEIYNRIRMFTICSFVGTSGEYIKLNSIIRDYILRIGFELTPDIKEMLNQNIEQFIERVDDPEYMNYLSFAEFSYYVKENLKKNNLIPNKFLYSTIYVKTIIELYNSGIRKYDRILDLVKEMKQSGIFASCDDDVKNVVQFYYCSSLARLKRIEFDAEVSYFRDNSLYEQYNFLKGFNYRLQGQYKMAESSYRKVLGKNSKHDKARRELVIIYTNMQDYDTALDLAEQNYRDYPENLYQMQAYFDCLIYRSVLSEKQRDDIEDIMNTAESIYRTTASEIYFQLKAKYLAFIEHNQKRALEILEEGSNKFERSFYIQKDYFDICRRYDDSAGMEKAFNKLKCIANSDNATFVTALLCREAYLNAYQGKSKVVIELKLRGDNHFTENAVDNIMNHVESIIKKKSIKSSY